MNKAEALEPAYLEGEAAVKLWQQGREAWNTWVEQNPDALISFDSVDFNHQSVSDYFIRFHGYNFPSGFVDFSNIKLGDRVLLFSNVTFESSDIFLSSVDFGDGGIIFSRCRFGVNNNNQNVVMLNNAIFGKKAQIKFVECIGNNAEFDFSNLQIHTPFLFLLSQPKNTGTKLLPSRIKVHNSVFSQSVNIRGNIASKALSELSLRNSAFESVLNLPDGRFNFIPDLVGTHLARRVTLHNLRCDFPTEEHKLWGPIKVTRSKDPEDFARLRRLKEIAEDNKDHPQALRFMAKEMRAKRWHPDQMSNMASTLDWIYDRVSSYGRSIRKPIRYWLYQLVLFAAAYFAISPRAGNWGDVIENAIEYSLANSFSFLGNSRYFGDKALEKLIQGDLSIWISVISYMQVAISLTLFFLIGLALRNHFRLR